MKMEKLKSLNLKGHLLTAISYMLPIVCGGGFLVAIGMAMGGTNMYAAGLIQGQFTFWDALATMGGSALGLLPLVISVGISFSIAGKPGIAPGFVAGLSAIAISAGFIGGILGDTSKNLWFFTEHIDDFLICSDTEGTDQHGYRYFTGTVNTYVENIVGIGFIFQPCTTVWNHGTGIEFFTDLIMADAVVDTRGTH